METRKLEKKKFSGASKVNDTLETIKKNKKKKEGSSHSVRDIPDGTKLGIQKKQGRLKKQTIISEIKLFDVPRPDQKIPSPEEEIIQSDIPPNKYLYVYGITNNKNIKLDFEGLKDQPIQKLEIGDIIALFSFYPVLHPMVEEKEALLHAEILNKLAGKTTIVPMAFGTVFKDQEILKTVLTKSCPEAKKTLELIKDKFELGVKVVKKGSQNVSKEINQKFLGELDKLGFKLVKEGESISGETNQNILEELNKLSVKSVAGDKFSERLLLNNSFLVEKNKFEQFSDKVGELEQKYQNLKFIYTGPWPAYSFVNINIKTG